MQKAVKAHDRLSQQEIRSLLKDMDEKRIPLAPTEGLYFNEQHELEKSSRGFNKRSLLCNPLLVITGPTASASDLAIQACSNNENVSADSMIYRYMDIGTAKPAIEERREYLTTYR